MNHTKFQYYRHNYCLVCMTGLLGCRWHRYKQSTRDSRKRDLFWFCVLTFTFLYMVFTLYFWLVTKNSFNNLNWFMYMHLGNWIPWYTIFLGFACASFTYLLIIMILCFSHVLHGHQMYIHVIHKIFIILILTGIVATTVMVENLWYSEWSTLYLSLQVTGPFLHIGAVGLMTMLSWIISSQWFRLSSCVLKLFWLFMFSALMIGLYISPLYIQSPCVVHVTNLPPKPKVIAHQGASSIFPENTIVSFENAVKYEVFGFETDVRISYDGVPFLMHDSTLRRTTNVADVYPELIDLEASFFNISQLKQLNAGNWFLKNNPMWSAGSLTDEERTNVSNQSVAILSDLVNITRRAGAILLFDLFCPTKRHPYHDSCVNLTVKVIRNQSLALRNVWWFEEMGDVPSPEGVTNVATHYHPVTEMKEKNLTVVNVNYGDFSMANIREYQEANISINIYLVNSKWFFSLYWCMGVSSVTSDRCDLMHSIADPVWHLSPNSYLTLWVTVDVLSAVVIITVFIVQRIRLFGTSFTPEMVSLNSGKPKHTKRTLTMKEKLLYSMTDSFGDHLQDNLQDSMEQRPSTSVVMNNAATAYSMASMNADSPSFPKTSTKPDGKYEIE